jgi:carbon-monoxide dehydrogenase medium subunit
MRDFSYAAAGSVEEAVSLLSAHGERAKILSGGTDILVQLREGQREADLVLDVKKIPELMTSTFDPAKGWTLGASVPCYQIYDNETLAKAYPAIADAARIIGGWQIQSRASLGGNLCNSSPAADSTPALIALDATCEIAGPQGRRRVAVSQFCTGPGKNVLARGEMLVALHFAPPEKNAGSAYLRFIPRNEMDIAVVGVGSWLQLGPAGDKVEAARIALGAVAPTAKVAEEAAKFLVGKAPTDEHFAQAGELAKKVASPISDKRGPAEYRLHLVGVLVKRTLTTAAARAVTPSTS